MATKKKKPAQAPATEPQAVDPIPAESPSEVAPEEVPAGEVSDNGGVNLQPDDVPEPGINEGDHLVDEKSTEVDEAAPKGPGYRLLVHLDYIGADGKPRRGRSGDVVYDLPQDASIESWLATSMIEPVEVGG